MGRLRLFCDVTRHNGVQYMRAEPKGKIHQLLHCIQEGTVVQKLLEPRNQTGNVPVDYLADNLPFNIRDIAVAVSALTRHGYLARTYDPFHFGMKPVGEFPGVILSPLGEQMLHDLNHNKSILLKE